MSRSTARRAPPERSEFRRFMPLTPRWNDVDVFGHVNNAVFAAWFDTAAVTILHEASVVSAKAPRFATLVAETTTRFHVEVLFTDRVEMGIAIGRLGRSSLTWRIGVFCEGRPTAAVDCEFTHVFAGLVDRRPITIPEDVRHMLSQLLTVSTEEVAAVEQ